ncbi:unnamed protein product [Choristocarpus tenellus]
MGMDVIETHSRKSQAYRTRVSESFRNNVGQIMFTSDVSARGLDYPDVTQVIQVGLPSDKAQYIHRLGRTARAGKGGSGLILLTEAEEVFLREVRKCWETSWSIPCPTPFRCVCLPAMLLSTTFSSWKVLTHTHTHTHTQAPILIFCGRVGKQ